MSLSKQLIKDMSSYFKRNKLINKLSSPVSEDYADVFKGNIEVNFGILPLIVSSENKFMIDFVVKSSIFLYLNEILSWNEVERLLNIRAEELTLKESYDILLPLTAVLFGEISYLNESSVLDYERFTVNKRYWDLPMYFYSVKNRLTYKSWEEFVDNVEWFIEELPEISSGLYQPSALDIVGMLRINNRFVSDIFKDKDKNIEGIETEKENLGLYNIALNINKVKKGNSEVYGLNDILHRFYTAIKSGAKYLEDNENFTVIDWSHIRNYSLYIDTIMGIDVNIEKLEKIKLILQEIQNFLIY